MTEIIIIFIMYYLISVAGWYFHLNYVIQPIMLAPIVGAIMGDLTTGVIMGGYLQAIFMGNMSVGGTVPAIPAPGSIVAVYFVIKTGVDIETGLALAYPISAMCSSIYSVFRQARIALLPKWQELGQTNPKLFDLCFNGYRWFACLLFPAIVLVSLLYGVELLEGLMATLPAWVLTACGAVGGVLAAVGMGVILSLIWNIETCGFFFVGFICFKIMGLSLTVCSILGVCAAVIYYFIDSRIAANQRAVANGVVAGGASTTDDGGDFF